MADPAAPIKSPRKFAGYPHAVEAPRIPYKKAQDKNPVFSGQLLSIGAWLITKLQPAQKYLWSNAGFDGLRELPHLSEYAERFDPTVIPLADSSTSSDPPSVDAKFFPQKPEELTGGYHSIADYHAMYLSGKLTPLAVAEYLLPLIRRDIKSPANHSVAFIDSKIELIMAAAKASTERYKAGAPLGIMDGVPTAIKDESDVAGYRTTGGRKKNDDFFKVAENSTRAVRLLQEAGAIILGKLNMHELGADTTNNNPNWGTPRDPHNDQYYTGGSSGGSAYVVAAGLVPFSVGADGGGSIRIPASFCGVYGLKPTHSRLEDTGSTVTVTGPLAATIDDLEIAYRTMAVPDPEDPLSSLFAPPGPPTTTIDIDTIDRYVVELRLGDAQSTAKTQKNPDSLYRTGCLENAVGYMKGRGYKVAENVHFPYLPEGQLAHAMTILSEMASHARAEAMDRNNWYNGLNAANKVLLAVGSQTPARDYLLAQQLRNLLMQHLAFLFKTYPGLVIVSPTTPMSGWPIASEKDLTHGVTDGNTSVLSMQYIWLANFCGLPAITVPMGYAEPKKGKGKIPLGFMAMAEWGAEDNLFCFGRAMEQWMSEPSEAKLGGGGRKRPANWVDVLGNAGGKTTV